MSALSVDKSLARFRGQYKSDPEVIVHAPGRVSVLGGHVDFCRGCVMPAAVNVGVSVAVSKIPGDLVHVTTADMDDFSSFPVKDPPRDPDKNWSNYVRGVISQLWLAGIEVPGLQIALAGDIAMGTGLSSSAALEVAVAMAILEITGASIGPVEIAKLCQRAENEFVGVKCGIMDQFASIHGMADHAIFLDCKTLDHSYVSLPPDTCIVIADTRKPRALAASDYNNRRKEVDEALGALREALPHIESLRDVTFDELAEHGARLSPESLRRAQHVVTEILRVCDAYDALKASDWALFGNLMRASHESSRDLYQSSIPELDVLWEIACSHPGCLGSRLTGAGFGGATVSIVELDAVADFRDRMISGYFQRTGIAARVDVMTASGGASRIR